jgi:hypothetical protein
MPHHHESASAPQQNFSPSGFAIGDGIGKTGTAKRRWQFFSAL